MSTLLISFCVCLVVNLARGDGVVRSESDLRKTLLQNYDNSVRPVRNVSSVVRVDASIVPIGIKDVDIKDKTIKLDTWLVLEWMDEFLRWDPTQFGGLAALRLPAEQVWRPDFSIYNSSPDSSLQPTVHTNVVIYHNGTVLWVPPFTFKSRCPVTANQVDKDKFKCTVITGSWTYDVTLVDIHDRREAKGGLKEFYDTEKEWTIDSLSSRRESKRYDCCIEEYATLYFDFVFKKKKN